MILAACLPLLAGVPKQSVEVVTTERADLAVGGTIRVEGSAGELNIQAWDEPQVEVTVTRSSFVKDTPEARDRMTRELKAIGVTSAHSGGELVISTSRRRSSDINLDYRIMVPRNSRLMIRHHTGDVIVDGVEGDIDADLRAGDIALLLPYSGRYAIDGHCRIGGVYSDFASSAAGSRKIRLRVGIGGIEIQKMGPYKIEGA